MEAGGVHVALRDDPEAGLPDANQVHRYARGEVLPSVQSLVAIARACRVALDWLATGEEPHAQADELREENEVHGIYLARAVREMRASNPELARAVVSDAREDGSEVPP